MANWDALPADLALGILARLPPSSVHQCRRVCRGWRSLVDDPHFAPLFKEHHRRRSRMPLFFYRRNFNLDAHVPDPEEHQGVARVDLQAIDMETSEAHSIIRFPDVPLPDEDHDGVFTMEIEDIMYPDSVFKVQGSCNGLLLISHAEILYLCNPATGHWRQLPSLNPDQVIVGFYLIDPPKDGQMLYGILYAVGTAEEEASYWIRVVGDDESLIEIGRPLSQGIQNLLDRILLKGLRPASESPHVTIQRVLYWLPPHPAMSSMIVMFDTLQARFRWMTSPRQGAVFRCFQLMELDGALGMACRNTARTAVEIWVRQLGQNQVKEEWVLRNSIGLPANTILNQLGYDQHRFPPVYIVPADLDVLIPCPYTLVHRRANGDERQRYHRLGHWVFATPHTYDENFAADGFFLVPVVNHDEEPPFLFTAVFGHH